VYRSSQAFINYWRAIKLGVTSLVRERPIHERVFTGDSRYTIIRRLFPAFCFVTWICRGVVTSITWIYGYVVEFVGYADCELGLPFRHMQMSVVDD